jgi:transcriptional regulator with XRE-family HTH domain
MVRELNKFQKFLIDEMQRRGMSNREFARFINVSNTTINRAVDQKLDKEPTLEFLVKVSEAIHVDVSTLVEMVHPQAVNENRISPTAKALAQRIENLPEDVQAVIAAIIRGSATQ